jgi:hypothetical protein
MLIPLKASEAGLSAADYGVISAVMNVSMLIGTLGFVDMLCLRFGRTRTFLGGFSAVGLAFMLVWSTHSLVGLSLLFGTVGFGCAFRMAGRAHRVLAIPAAYRLQLTSAQSLIVQFAGIIGPILAALCLNLTSVSITYAILGVVVAGSTIMLCMYSPFADFLNAAQSDVENYYRRLWPTAFQGIDG